MRKGVLITAMHLLRQAQSSRRLVRALKKVSNFRKRVKKRPRKQPYLFQLAIYKAGGPRWRRTSTKRPVESANDGVIETYSAVASAATASACSCTVSVHARAQQKTWACRRGETGVVGAAPRRDSRAALQAPEGRRAQGARARRAVGGQPCR